MATCDHPSELAYRIGYPNLQRPGLRIERRFAALPAKEERTLPLSSNLQEKEVGDIFYFVGPRPRNPWASIGSFIFLSVLLLALILIPLFHTDPLPTKQTLTMLYLEPPAAGGHITNFQAPKLASTYTPTSVAVPHAAPKAQEAPAPAAKSDGVVGGVPGGLAGGIPGGVLSQVLSTNSVPVPVKTPDATPVKRIRVAARVVEANLIHDVTPQYPPEAGRARIEGAVVLFAVIGTDGSVKDVRVESGLPILAQAAMDAVKQWRYKPYTINGEPVEVDSRITINFTLSAS